MNNLELKSLSLEELQNLSNSIKSEIELRNNSNKPSLVLYTHNCKNSANYHKNKYKHWSKVVKGVDATKTNGYAFIGEFLNINYEHKIPHNSIVVEVCGSEITAYKMGDEPIKLAEARTNSMSSFIEEIASLL